jgi:hypothetical protein
MVKAMLEQDYYMTMFSVYGPDENRKDEILNGLIRADEILHNYKSADSVASVALAYYELDLYNKYVDIIKKIDPNYKSFYDVLEGMEE